jgi:hypothetical protein
MEQALPKMKLILCFKKSKVKMQWLLEGKWLVPELEQFKGKLFNRMKLIKCKKS